MRLRITLNGTAGNPYHKWGLTQNPLPQLGVKEYDAACLQLQKLGGDPIPNEQYIRDTLRGFDKEFIELCVREFKPGFYVTFEVTWPDDAQPTTRGG
jgi:hypothetical protein